MPDNDYEMLWEVSKFDWQEVKKRFEDKLPNKDAQRLNKHLNVSFPLVALLVNLNKRVEELEYELNEIKGGKRLNGKREN